MRGRYTMRVDELMSAPVFVAAPEDTVGHVKNLMLKHKVSRIIVVYERALAGVITKYD
ncbi:MAG: CBS domain-containing protein, partial [Halobacteriota archaeon]